MSTSPDARPAVARKPKGEPSFMSRSELAFELGCSGQTVDSWVRAGTIPPPWIRPGPQSALWRRRDFAAFVATGRWPDEAFRGRENR